MKYFKLYNENGIIGVSTSDFLRKYQKKHNIFLCADIQDAQYIVCDALDGSGEAQIYHADWMCPEHESQKGKFLTVQAAEITEEEFLTLYGDADALKEESEKIIIDNMPEPQPEEEVLEPLEQMTLEYVQEQKIAELSAICAERIKDGVYLTFDGKEEHFTLTEQDQITIMALAQMAAQGIESIPYHSVGNDCKFYTAEQITELATAAQNKVIVETTYFQSAKKWIKKLKSITYIKSIEYGAEVPKTSQSEVYKAILA